MATQEKAEAKPSQTTQTLASDAQTTQATAEGVPPIGAKASMSKTVTEADIVMFAGVTGDFNPLHLDSEYAKHTVFGQRIAHGILSVGFISAVLGTKLPGPGSIYLSQKARFLKPVRIGDTITTTVEVIAYRPDKRIITLKTDCFNQEGVQVLEGEAALMLPRPRSQA